MSNPYEAFNISDDEEDQFVQNKANQVRKSTFWYNIAHKERR